MLRAAQLPGCGNGYSKVILQVALCDRRYRRRDQARLAQMSKIGTALSSNAARAKS